MKMRWHILKILGVVLMVTALAVTAGAVPPPLMITLESVSPYYQPARASISTESAVVWVNPTPSYHTVRHDGCVDGSWCAFNSGSVPPNGRFTIAHLPPGEYAYHCELHPIMRGVLIVTPAVRSTES